MSQNSNNNNVRAKVITNITMNYNEKLKGELYER